jgi:hypothetical protein
VVEAGAVTDLIISELFPSRAIVDLQDEMVSNGMLPYVHVGELIEHTLRHLFGQTRAAPGLWLGSTTGPLQITDGGNFTRRFMLKPGARDIMVDLVFSTPDEDREFEVAVSINSGSTLKTVTRSVPAGQATTLNQALQAFFTIYNVGDDPGKLSNYDASADVKVACNGADLYLWSVSLHQLHTAVIEQD